MPTLLDEFKEYLRVDGTYEDTTLNTFLESAKKTLIGSGVQLPKDYYAVDENGEEKYSSHRLVVMTLAAHYYENRQISSQNAQNLVPFSVQTMILQLKWVDIDESSPV